MIGLEGDFSGANVDPRLPGAGAVFFQSELQSLATLRGRVGYAFDRSLIYLTGGASYGMFEHSGIGIFPFSHKEDTWGWVMGGGLEYALGGPWSVKLEYLYSEFDDVTFTGIAFFSVPTTVDFNVQILRVGLNYRF